MPTWSIGMPRVSAVFWMSGRGLGDFREGMALFGVFSPGGGGFPDAD